MTCPFLKEAEVKYCGAGAVRKLIPLAQGGKAEEKCGSSSHTSCSAWLARPAAAGADSLCPYLRDSLMQYCAAAPVSKFVPYSESLLSRCGTDGFRYCELYLSIAHEEPPDEVEGVPLPGRLAYAANHMWLDIGDDGVCHAGIDAMMSRVLGTVDQITYVWQKGRRRPAAILTVGALNFEVVFPNAFLLTNCNLYLRSDPARLTAAPYTSGWLFEGVTEPETGLELMRGARARAWMEEDQRRLIGEALAYPGLAADGGLPERGLARILEREHMLSLYHEFFSPYRTGKGGPQS
jgi:glycine cleavage system H lipoate-binding protein